MTGYGVSELVGKKVPAVAAQRRVLEFSDGDTGNCLPTDYHADARALCIAA